MVLTRTFVVPSAQVSSCCTVERGLDSLLGAGRIRASGRSSRPLEADAVPERLRERTSQMAVAHEWCALSPPHPSEDCFRQKTPPRRLWTLWDEARPRGVWRDTVRKRLEDQCQVAFRPVMLIYSNICWFWPPRRQCSCGRSRPERDAGGASGAETPGWRRASLLQHLVSESHQPC